MAKLVVAATVNLLPRSEDGKFNQWANAEGPTLDQRDLL